MKDTQHQSLASGAPSQSADLADSTTEREKANAAAASDRVDEAAPQHEDAADVGHPNDVSVDRGMASPGAAAQAEASARHATENVPGHDRRSKR